MATMDSEIKFIAYHLDGTGGARQLQLTDLDKIHAIRETVWVHMDYTLAETQSWIRENSGLNELISEALLAEETRPRSVTIGDGILLVLRGVNLNPGAVPEDMVSIRIWVEQNRIISTHHRRLLSVGDMRALFEKNAGPKDSSEFITMMAYLLIDRVEGVVETINDEVDELEGQIVTVQSHELRPRIADLRRQIIGLRRYLSPQRETMVKLSNEKVSWMSEVDRMHLREVGDALMRYVEDLDSARDRAAVTQEELISRLSEQMDHRMYVLSMVAAIFLPLSFITGLLGINVGGIPGTDYKPAFLIVCGILLVLVMIQYWVFKRQKWF